MNYSEFILFNYQFIFYGIIDRRNYEFSYCIAGHVIGLILDYNDQKLSYLNVSTPSIKKNSSYSFKDNLIGLNPRDRIIICSKGIINIEIANYFHGIII